MSARFDRLTFEDFKTLARDNSLSPNEKIGFPESYRAGQDELILTHMRTRLPALNNTGAIVVDIGCGCSNVATQLIAHSKTHAQSLWMLDSEEMLAQLPNASHVKKIPGAFPNSLSACAEIKGKADAIIVFSVLHHVFLSQNIFSFIDAALELLKSGGMLLLGDLPNISKRNRFLSSDRGKKFHRSFMKTESDPEISHLTLTPDKIDDAVILSILSRYRVAGFETYLLPQSTELSMANRREDIVIEKW